MPFLPEGCGASSMIFRSVRKKKNEISDDLTKKLLSSERRGIIAVNGDGGYPYAVPINYFFDEAENKIYFHGARSGYKVDLIKKCDKVCFTVYGNATVKEEKWAPYVQSAVAFGKCRLTEDPQRAAEILRLFAKKYYPDEKSVDAEIENSGKFVQMFEIEIEHMSGKEIQEK